MKKLLTLVMSVLMSVTLVSCGATDSAYELYTNAVAAMEEAGASEAKTTVSMVMSYGEESLDFTTTSHMKQIVHSESDVEIFVDTEVEMMGSSASSSTYYKDGWYYMESNGSKMKMTLDLSTAEGMSNTDMLVFDESAIISHDMKKVDDGTEISLTINTDSIMEQIDAQLSGLSEIMGTMGEDVELTYSDVTVNAKFDDNGMLSTMDMQFGISVTAEGETINVEATTNTEYIAFGDDVTIDAPADLDSYVEIDASALLAQ